MPTRKIASVNQNEESLDEKQVFTKKVHTPEANYANNRKKLNFVYPVTCPLQKMAIRIIAERARNSFY